MKKFRKGLFASAVLVGSLFFSPTDGEAADWKLVDSSIIGNGTVGYLNGAKGGKAKICLKEAFGGANVTVYDDDGSSRSVIKATSFWGNNSCYTFNVDPYVDGADNDAEFVVTTTRNIVGNIKFELWD